MTEQRTTARLRDAMSECSGWQDISTAPRDHDTRVLVTNAANIACAYWDKGSRIFDIIPHWRDTGHNVLFFEPTAWMPLPQPPEDV